MHRVAILTLGLSALAAFAQVNTASLTGLVKDSSEAVVPGAKVTARNTATGAERSTVSNGDGYYFLANLPIGTWEIAVENTGFQRAVSTVTLDATERGRQDFVLTIGTVAATANVEATAPLLSPDDASLGTVVDNKYFSEYPLLLRSWDDLVNLVAGVQGQRYTDQGGSTSAGRTGGFNVHGVRQLENNFLLDGVDNNSISENVQELTTQVARPSVDALEEFKVVTNPYSAEYSRGGAVISVISKGGTNELHGTLYEYLRNRDTDAEDFFSNRQGLAKAENVRNQFGGNLGGPIKKNKLFVFFDEETTRIITGQLRSGTVPLDNERIGNFSAAAAAAAHTTYPTIYLNGSPAPNNIIPQSALSPVAESIMALFPEPTVAGADLNNYFRNAPLTDNTNRYSTRADWQASDKDSVFWRFTWSDRGRNSPGLFSGIADGTSSSSQGDYQLTAYQSVIGWTRPITPTLLNEFRVGYEHDNSYARQEPFGQPGGNLIPNVPNDPAFAGGVTMITFSNYNTFIGSPNFLPKFQKTQQWQFSDTVSWTKGKHQFKFGADLHAPQIDRFQDVPGLRGALNFAGIFTCERNAVNQCVSGTGNSYADFLVGDPQSALLSNLFDVHQKWYWFDFFAQDDFKVTPKLTLNLGMRYDFASPVWEGNNHLSNFDPANGGSIVTASSGSLYDRALVQPQKLDFSPRFGFAYQLTPQTVLRGGYGIFYVPFDRAGSENQLALNPPAFINNTLSLQATATQPVFPLNSGFPASFLNPADVTYPDLHIRATNPDDLRANVQQWSLGIQRELPHHFLIEADYVGSKGTHLLTLSNLNQAINNGRQILLNQNNQPVLPFPNFGLIEYSQNDGNSSYNGLDLTVERRFSGGLSARLAYTWSKSIDDTAEELSVYGSNAFSQITNNQRAWRGPSDYDVPQRVVFSWVYELPLGRGKPWLASGVASKIFGGFQVAGAYTYSAGRPFTPFASANNVYIDPYSEEQALPNVIGTPVMIDNVSCWFYTTNNPGCKGISGSNAFSIPAPYFFGNAGRNSLRGPNLVYLDASVSRTFTITERIRLQFRAEAFNLSNTVAFGLPNANVSGGSPGVITSLAADPRIMQFAGRLSF
ncbi:MAG TPA: TonB-dependent receptor [Bryobacteraceae bacterium]